MTKKDEVSAVFRLAGAAARAAKLRGQLALILDPELPSPLSLAALLASSCNPTESRLPAMQLASASEPRP